MVLLARQRIMSHGPVVQGNDSANGIYSIFIEPDQIGDTSGNYVDAGFQGSFVVNIGQYSSVKLVSYDLVDLRRVGQTLYEHDYTVTLKNMAFETLQGQRFVVVDSPDNISVLNKDVLFATIEPFDTLGQGTIQILADHSEPVDVYGMDWRVVDYYAGDVSMDGVVGLTDMVTLCENWLNLCDLQNIWCYGADLDRSGAVDLYDFQLLANDWLEEK